MYVIICINMIKYGHIIYNCQHIINSVLLIVMYYICIIYSQYIYHCSIITYLHIILLYMYKYK